MAVPREKLATSLAELERLQKRGRRVFRSKELTRVHRERLVRNGFLREVMKGWLISSSPSASPGDSTPWFASFWEFCAYYCNERFGEEWNLSPEQSLLLYAECTVIPTDLSPFFHPPGSRVRSAFEPIWACGATGWGAEPGVDRRWLVADGAVRPHRVVVVPLGRQRGAGMP